MMENVELDKFLAEEVMGWHLLTSDEIDFGEYAFYHDKNNYLIMMVCDWHPTTDIAQAMMCAKEADKELHIHIADHHGCPFEVESKFGEFSLVCHSVEEVARAICHAIYEAVKGGE